MRTGLELNATEQDFCWTRVSSFKPYLLGALLTALAAACLLALLHERSDALALITAGFTIALGVMALNWKVVHKRANDFRISTLFYSEVVTVDDVCMTVTNPGPLWTRFRIHLRRPARFGWMVSFVPADEALLAPTTSAKPNEASRNFRSKLTYNNERKPYERPSEAVN